MPAAVSIVSITFFRLIRFAAESGAAHGAADVAADEIVKTPELVAAASWIISFDALRDTIRKMEMKASMIKDRIVVILGSGPSASAAAEWPKPANLSLVSINNAWRVRPDWDYQLHAGDFPSERHPTEVGPNQQVHSHQSYVPSQNRYGGFVYAGGTMAFTAGYWALDVLRPRVLAYFACDMVYCGTKTHFYGRGAADPLRDDLTLRSLEAKSARLMNLAARQGCSCVNLSTESNSRLVFPRAGFEELAANPPIGNFDSLSTETALAREEALGYLVEDGEYWRHLDSFDADALAHIDTLWLKAAAVDQRRTAAA